MNRRTTRLAPSPTGTLHLGHARTFLFTWALARTCGWRLPLRLEDLDRTRVRPGARQETIELLRWLGMDWDGPPRTLAEDLEPYREAMDRLARKELIFRCDRTRRDLLAAVGAPHASDGETPHPAALRPTDRSAWRFDRQDAVYRLRTDDMKITIDDRIAGPRCFQPAQEAGDFALWTKLGVPAYQLAICVDDARDGVTDVVRGDDLLPSAARQTIVHRHLDQSVPDWWHLPLVTDESDRRLAKRDGLQRLTQQRDAGVPGNAVVGLVAYWCGLRTERRIMTNTEFLSAFDPDRLPRNPVRLTEEDLRWLMEQR